METPLWDPISETAKDLIQRMLTTDVNHRITIQEVLNHKWLRVSRPSAGAPSCVRQIGGATHSTGRRKEKEYGDPAARRCNIDAMHVQVGYRSTDSGQSSSG